jgi:hypothetical protein
MKKLIGMIAFATIVLFGYAHQAPSVRVDAGASSSSSSMAPGVLVAQGPTSLVCTWPRPFCCDPDPEDGGCYACAGDGTQCP